MSKQKILPQYELIQKGGFKPVQRIKVQTIMRDGEFHHRTMTISQHIDLEGYVMQHVNDDGLVLIVPVE